jgi:hypothetical protein
MDEPQTRTREEWDPVFPKELTEVDRKRFPGTMELWYPELKTLAGVNTPRTAWVNLERHIIEEGTVHEMTSGTYNVEELRAAVKQVGGPPAFIRTDMSTNIKDSDGMKITSIDTPELESSAGSIIQYNRSWAEVPVSSLVVREWLDIEHFFTAWDGKKIGVEVRFFSEGSSLEGWCFDWDPSELQPDNSNWKELYDKTESIAEEHISEITDQAQTVANHFSSIGTGSWSIDFVRTVDGTWYCTDMAPRNQSQVAQKLRSIP